MCRSVRPASADNVEANILLHNVCSELVNSFLEIQHMNEKMDKLINDQWKHLLEIQQMQMEMIEELTKSRQK